VKEDINRPKMSQIEISKTQIAHEELNGESVIDCDESNKQTEKNQHDAAEDTGGEDKQKTLTWPKVARVTNVDAATSCDAALRVVLDHRESDVMKRLREENERLGGIFARLAAQLVAVKRAIEESEESEE
jgi:hypothetical protein